MKLEALSLLQLILAPLLTRTQTFTNTDASLWTWRGQDIPGPRTTQSTTPSACANGPASASTYAFACPHQMLLSNDMRAAAARDGLNATFAYALAGCATDSECGTCYQVRLGKAEKVWKPNFPLLVVQCANSGFDVLPGQLDIYVGAGGQGYFTAVNSDCKTRFCEGGPCKDNLYETDFAVWTDAEFPDTNKCYSGGVKQFDNTTRLRQKCLRLIGNRRERKHVMLYQSCIRSNTAYLHQNFYETTYERVQCPDSLVRVSGMQRSDDASYPKASRGLRLTQSCKGSIDSGHACITTMMDGCIPSCAWEKNIPTVPGYPSITRCDKNGRILG